MLLHFFVHCKSCRIEGGQSIPVRIVTRQDMTIPLISRFSVSTISSTQTTSSTNGEESATKAGTNSRQAAAQPSWALAALSEKQRRRQGIVMDPGVQLRFATVSVKTPAKLVNISPRDADLTAPTKPLGLPPNSKAFLTGQMPHKADTPDTKAGRQYGLPTAANRANLKQRPVAMPMQATHQVSDRSRTLNPRDNKAQAAKLNDGWRTAQEILGTEDSTTTD